MLPKCEISHSQCFDVWPLKACGKRAHQACAAGDVKPCERRQRLWLQPGGWEGGADEAWVAGKYNCQDLQHRMAEERASLFCYKACGTGSVRAGQMRLVRHAAG